MAFYLKEEKNLKFETKQNINQNKIKYKPKGRAIFAGLGYITKITSEALPSQGIQPK